MHALDGLEIQMSLPSASVSSSSAMHYTNGHRSEPPSYKTLPQATPGYRCSWTYFNAQRSNKLQRDQIGTINFLTPERVKAARNEIQVGETIPLDLELSSFRGDISAFGGRPAPEHTVKMVAPFAAEDHLSFNTQSSSQWDGLKHFGLRATGQFYNGYTSNDLQGSDCLGVHHWCERGGIVGRGVLVDWYAWASRRNPHISMNTGYTIKLDEILAVLSHQNTHISKGDILLIRTGWTQWYLREEPALRHEHMCIQHAPGSHSFIGVAAEEDFVEWIWDNQVAAAASDSPAFEATPPNSEGFGWLHEHLLAGLGCPIGELFDLERLSRACAQAQRWSFFLSSTPLYIRGGVASPSNAIAIL